jgi:FAD/FMN-containing dehydrogenase
MSARVHSVQSSPFAPPTDFSPGAGQLVNDIHSRLNATSVAGVVRAPSIERLREIVRAVAHAGRSISVAGGRHAMGAQQFGTGTVLIDTRSLSRVHQFDRERGTIEVEAGIQWPELIDYLQRSQEGSTAQWGIAQKQTGADRLTIGGAVAANIHGRGLRMKPFIGDVEALTLVTATGELVRCSRGENAELFRLAVGGYGLFGIVATVTLRLTPRRKLRRAVEVLHADGLVAAFERRIADGFLYGDFQFAIDPSTDDFLRRGIFSSYAPIDAATPIPERQRALSPGDWQSLLDLAHTRKREAFEAYERHYLATDGQLYWSDTHQMSTYLDDYHPALDRRIESAHAGSEMITELYVPRPMLSAFLAEARDDFRTYDTNVIYGTVRLIERDDESFLAWAKEPYACTIFNLHVDHTPDGVDHAAEAFRRLIETAARRGGSYYLTYHRFATRDQVSRCYPQMPHFLRLKRRYDPAEVFQSDWYRHYRRMFSEGEDR